jgi:sigma-E factor negative regulatory protein RseA
MNEERPENRQGERDSQLSAMFDGELPGAECELLARRLTRDEALRAQWSRFSMIGAALRSERGIALHDRVAWRVSSVVAQETTYGDGTVDTATSIQVPVASPASIRTANARWARFARPIAGASIAAGVAALSIMWLRTDVGPGVDSNSMLASNAAPETIVLTPEVTETTVARNTPVAERVPSNGEPDVYVTPAPSSTASIAPPARLANYVVAHSEYSGPLSRRMALLGLVATDPEAAAPAGSDKADDTAAGAADAQ